MSRAGYVLVGGHSRRMGRDKAFLPYRGQPLGAWVARLAEAAAGSVTLVGDPARYASLGFPVIPDRLSGAGPLAGIHAALEHTQADWNLVLACDMPGLELRFLHSLLREAETRGAACLAPAGPSGLFDPLCAVYHRRALPLVRQALHAGTRKLSAVLDLLGAAAFPIPAALGNANTPQQWEELWQPEDKGHG